VTVSVSLPTVNEPAAMLIVAAPLLSVVAVEV
jgi:hypothetical protein